MPKALNTALTQLRRKAPGSLTQQGIVDYMAGEGLDVDQVTISDFERAKYMPADERFIPLYAKVIRQSQTTVRETFNRVRGQKAADRGKARQPSKR